MIFTSVNFLIQILNVLLNVTGKIQGMLSGQALGEFGIAFLEGFNNVDMVNDGSPGTIIFIDRPHPNRAHVDKQILGHLVEQVAMTDIEQRLMKANIRFRVFINMGVDGVVVIVREHSP